MFKTKLLVSPKFRQILLIKLHIIIRYYFFTIILTLYYCSNLFIVVKRSIVNDDSYVEGSPKQILFKHNYNSLLFQQEKHSESIFCLYQ